MSESAPGESGTPGARPPAADDTLIGSVRQLGDELAELFREGMRLLGVESRLFVSSLLLIAILAGVAGFVIAGAIVFLGVAVVLLLMSGGLDPPAAVLLVTVGLLAVAVGIFFWIRRLARHLKFTHSRQMLAGIAARRSGDTAGGGG